MFSFLEKDKCGHYELLLDDWWEDAWIAPIVFSWEKIKNKHTGFEKTCRRMTNDRFVF